MKIKSWNDDRITFDDGSYISYKHDQECSEYNYADFSVLDVMLGRDKDDMEFDSFEIDAVDDGGFLIKLKLANNRIIRWPYACYPYHNIFIPCYSEQNGYYTTDIAIVYSDKEGNAIEYWYIDAQLKLY